MSQSPPLQHFALKSQRVIIDDQIKAACVEIKEGKISAIHGYDAQLDCAVKDLANKLLMPGLVDTHVHINEPGRTEWEGFNSATQAAAAGGITTLVDMPLNCIPVTTTKAAFEQKLNAVKDKLWADCGFWGGVIPGNLDQLDELLCAGVLGVKSFLIDSGIDEFPNVSAEHIRRALPILAKHQVPYLIHAEIDCGDQRQAKIGKRYRGFLDSRPKNWENKAVSLMLDLALEAKNKGLKNHIHIVHLSSDEALGIIRQAKQRGLNFSAETCPHYLTLAAETIPDGKTLFKCCPPIREEKNRQHLWQAIKDETISFIVSDHSPCTPQLKAIDSGDLEKAWGGISALQFGLPLIWTEAIEQNISITEISRLMSYETAKFAGLDSFKGQIAIGFDADLVVFDDTPSYKISREMIKHRHKISPYVGQQVIGVIEQTYLRGHKIFENNCFIGGPLGHTLLKQSIAVTRQD
ncbi:MAG: allantoinase AllB [Enterobacterales bacterium]|nr:allantoinase AllB [Enterobacterales bacterium]